MSAWRVWRGPLRDYALNHIVNRLPFVDLRMRCYAVAGVHFEDRTTSMIMLGAEIFAPRSLSIGVHTIIGRCSLDARGGIRVGANVNMSSGVTLQTATHDVQSPTFEGRFTAITIADRVWIAQNAMVLGGVVINEGAVVAAGAVVRTDVPAYTIVGGVPARHLGDRTRDLPYQLDFRGGFY